MHWERQNCAEHVDDEGDERKLPYIDVIREENCPKNLNPIIWRPIQS